MFHKGTQAERLVAKYLRRRGYTIVARNYVIGTFGELDIIAERDGLISFVEVRSRTTDHHGSPAETIGHTKRDKLRKLASVYLERHAPDLPARFDVASVVMQTGQKPAIEYIEDAFE